MRRAARLAESWSRVLGGQPMTFGVAHMKPRRSDPSMTTTCTYIRVKLQARFQSESATIEKSNELGRWE
jgi:hypothetical protein